MINKKLKLSIAIPCFNEPDNIGEVLKQFQKILSDKKFNVEIIVIDGGSTDHTPSILQQLFKKLDPSVFKLILMTSRRGYGFDITYALNQATGDVLSWTHADLQTDPRDVLRAFEYYMSQKSNKIVVKGRRKNRRLTEVMFTFGMQIISWFVLKTYLNDINAQPKLFSRQFYQKYIQNNAPSDFSLDLYALYQAKINGMDIHEIPVLFTKRLFGEAKGGSGSSFKTKFNLIKRTFLYILKLRQNII